MKKSDVCLNHKKIKHMARQIGPPYIVGTLGGLNYYKSNGSYYVRLARGTSKGSKKKKQSERSKENCAEFTEIMTVGKAIRHALGWYWSKLKNPQRSGKLVKYLKFVKNSDRESARGERKVWKGILTEEGKNHLRGIDLNHVAPLHATLLPFSALEAGISGIGLSGLDPSKDIRFPLGKTGVRITGILLAADIQANQYQVYESNSTDLHRDGSVSDLSLTFPHTETAAPIRFILLSMIFLEEGTSGQPTLASAPENVLSILSVL